MSEKYFSQLKLPDGTKVSVKDSKARELIAELQAGQSGSGSGSKLYRHDICLRADYIATCSIYITLYNNVSTSYTASAVIDEELSEITTPLSASAFNFLPTHHIPATGYYDGTGDGQLDFTIYSIWNTGTDITCTATRNNGLWEDRNFRYEDIEFIDDVVTEIVLSPLENGDEVAY